MNEFSRETTRVMGDKQLDCELWQKIKLDVIEGVDKGKSIVSNEKIVHVGTQSANGLILHDDAVSRIHVEIRIELDGLHIRDLGSSNGTWIGDAVRISDATITSGTIITLGQTKIRITALQEKASRSLSQRPGFGNMIGVSPAMRAIFSTLERVAPTDETILIMGETGTGKEVCAHSIVSCSRRKNGPFVIVDCGALPPSLLESELFGHARGAFTGAHIDYKGAFERAHGGTVFLDEIGELPLSCQTRLLRAVETRVIRRIGDGKQVPLDVRFVAATNRPLEEEVNRGTFRADLYYRLSVVQVRIPALRDRLEDIEVLAKDLLRTMDPGDDVALTRDLLTELKRYRWPGNIRELRNYLRRWVMGGEDPGLPSSALKKTTRKTDIAIDFEQPFKELKETMINRFERSYLSELMSKAEGNISLAARIAQTDRTYLTRLLSKHAIEK